MAPGPQFFAHLNDGHAERVGLGLGVRACDVRPLVSLSYSCVRRPRMRRLKPIFAADFKMLELARHWGHTKMQLFLFVEIGGRWKNAKTRLNFKKFGMFSRFLMSSCFDRANRSHQITFLHSFLSLTTAASSLLRLTLVGVSTPRGFWNQKHAVAPVQVIKATVHKSNSVTGRCWIPRTITWTTSQIA